MHSSFVRVSGCVAAACLLAVLMTGDPLPMLIAAVTLIALLMTAMGLTRRR